MDTRNHNHFSLLESQKITRQKIVEQFIKFRKAKNLTQGELADSIGIPRPSISRFENGDSNPTLDTMVKIADGLGLSLDISLKQKSEPEKGKKTQAADKAIHPQTYQLLLLLLNKCTEEELSILLENAATLLRHRISTPRTPSNK